MTHSRSIAGHFRRRSSAGTFTRQTVALTLTVSADGAANGSFQSGDVPYTATGTASLREGVSSPITLTLDSATSGEASVGMSCGWRSIGASGSLGKGSRGLLTGTLSALGTFSGQYRAPLGNYNVSMACSR